MLGLAVDAAEFNDEVIRDNPVAEGLLGDIGPVPGEVHRGQVTSFEAHPLGLRQTACVELDGIGLDELAQDISLPSGHVGRGSSDFPRIAALAPRRRQDVVQFAVAELGPLSVFGGEIGLQSPRQFLFTL